MPVQRYDIRFRDKFFIERHWKPANYPVFAEGGRVTHIIHHVEDVTRAVQAAARPLPPGAQMDYAARAESCAERARRSVSPSNRKLWLDLEQQFRELEALRKRV